MRGAPCSIRILEWVVEFWGLKENLVRVDRDCAKAARIALPILLNVTKAAQAHVATRGRPRGDAEADACDAAFLAALAKVTA